MYILRFAEESQVILILNVLLLYVKTEWIIYIVDYKLDIFVYL